MLTQRQIVFFHMSDCAAARLTPNPQNPIRRYNFPAFGRVMAVYVVPTSAGHCRMITRFIKSKKGSARRPGLMGLFLKVIESFPVVLGDGLGCFVLCCVMLGQQLCWTGARVSTDMLGGVPSQTSSTISPQTFMSMHT
jgi:hypothetical protein